MSNSNPLLVSIVGPTASGKTALAIEIARYFETEIISADSRQFYKELKIGTAKPSREELTAVKHHFIDSHHIHEEVSAGKFEQLALALLDRLFEKHKVVIVVGGSGLYLKALWQGMNKIPVVDKSVREELNERFKAEGLNDLLSELEEKDPDYFNEVDQNNPQRIIRALEVIRVSGVPYSAFRNEENLRPRPFRNLIFGLEMNRETLYERIDRRMDQMISQGLFEEAKALWPLKEYNSLQTVGYQEVFGFLEGAYDEVEAVRLLKRNSRRYAKRQMTWFRKQENIIWIEPDQINTILTRISAELGIEDLG